MGDKVFQITATKIQVGPDNPAPATESETEQTENEES